MDYLLSNLVTYSRK